MKLAIAIALAAIVLGADRPDLARLAAWVSCAVATVLVAVAVRRA